MDIDETKKRKVEEAVPKPEIVDLEAILKAHVESSQNMAKLIAILTQKVLTVENVFSKDLFKQ